MKGKIFFNLNGMGYAALLVFLFAALGSLNVAAQNGLPDSTTRQALDAHNAFRQEVSVPPLAWSAELAQFAQNWANELANNRDCKLAHRPSEEGDLWKQHYGENIYSGGGSDWIPTFVDAVAAWGKEKDNFDFNTKECKGEVCGHYTQMIWKNTTRVGCAIATCPDGNVIVVCNYDPPGNYSGETPY